MLVWLFSRVEILLYFHCGMECNDQIDELAKAGALLPKERQEVVPRKFEYIKAVINSKNRCV